MRRDGMTSDILIHILVERGGGGGGGQGVCRPPNNLRGGATYPLPPPPHLSTHIFLQFIYKTGKNHKLKGKIIINVTLI